MVVIDTVGKAVRHLAEGDLLAKVTIDYLGMTNECLVSGRLMGLTKEDWWYTIIRSEVEAVFGILEEKLFVELYQSYYIKEKKVSDDRVRYYTLNDVCPIQEFPRYKHQIDCWSEYTLKPKV